MKRVVYVVVPVTIVGEDKKCFEEALRELLHYPPHIQRFSSSGEDGYYEMYNAVKKPWLMKVKR